MRPRHKQAESAEKVLKGKGQGKLPQVSSARVTGMMLCVLSFGKAYGPFVSFAFAPLSLWGLA